MKMFAAPHLFFFVSRVVTTPTPPPRFLVVPPPFDPYPRGAPWKRAEIRRKDPSGSGSGFNVEQKRAFIVTEGSYWLLLVLTHQPIC